MMSFLVSSASGGVNETRSAKLFEIRREVAIFFAAGGNAVGGAVSAAPSLPDHLEQKFQLYEIIKFYSL
jgi:hypothetical protein